MSTKKTKPGRKPVAAKVASITLRMDAKNVAAADALAADMGRVITGLHQSRMDVLRTAVERGLASMREEVDARLNQAGR